jgi:hypothetical protein
MHQKVILFALVCSLNNFYSIQKKIFKTTGEQKEIWWFNFVNKKQACPNYIA